MIGPATSGSAARRRQTVQRNHTFVLIISDPADNKLVGRKLAALIPVGIYNPIIRSHIKDACVSLFQLGLYAEFLFDFSRQTGSLFTEASLYTIGDFDTHALLLFVLTSR